MQEDDYAFEAIWTGFSLAKKTIGEVYPNLDLAQVHLLQEVPKLEQGDEADQAKQWGVAIYWTLEYFSSFSYVIALDDSNRPFSILWMGFWSPSQAKEIIFLLENNNASKNSKKEKLKKK